MGCDIHFFVERYSSDDYEGPKSRDIKIKDIISLSEPAWIPVDNYLWNPSRFGEGSVGQDEFGRGYWNTDGSFYDNKNYYIFSILADVRNGSDRIEPISDPRGVPEDCCYPYRVILEQWGLDAHSKSYFTLEELLNIDWSIYNEDWISDFLKAIEKMKEIKSDPKDIRCLFFFDN